MFLKKTHYIKTGNLQCIDYCVKLELYITVLITEARWLLVGFMSLYIIISEVLVFFGESTFSAVDKKCINWDHYTSAFHLGVNKPHISSSCHISPSLRLSHSLIDLHPAAWDRIRSPSKILVAVVEQGTFVSVFLF